MLQNLLLALCLLPAINLSAMDKSSDAEDEEATKADEPSTLKEKNTNGLELTSDIGITVGQAVEVMVASKKIWEGEPSEVASMVGFAALITMMFPAFIPGVLVSILGCKDVDMSDPTGVCIAGLVMNSVPVFVATMAACSWPLAYCYNRFAVNKNAQSRRHVGQTFTKARDLEAKATEGDMRVMGPSLKDLTPQALSDIYSKLSPRQALVLAESDFNWFIRSADGSVGEATKLMCEKLILLCKKDAAELSEALIDAEVEQLCSAHPYFWQTLVRVLPANVFNDKDVQRSLRTSFLAMLKSKNIAFAEEEADDAISQIAQGIPLASFFINEVLVTDAGNINDEEIILQTTEGQLAVKKSQLVSVSGYFRGAFSNSWTSTPVNLTGENPAWVSVVAKAANLESIELTENNFWQTLKAAQYFHVPTVITQCDRFLRDFGLSKKLLKEYWDDEVREGTGDKSFDDKSFTLKWNMCRKYLLTEAKRGLAVDIVQKLNALTMTNAASLKDAELLTKADFAEVADNFDLDGFNRKLDDSEFLSFIWKNVRHIGFLKDIVLAFCAQAQNKALVERTWFPIPRAIKRAMAQNNDQAN